MRQYVTAGTIAETPNGEKLDQHLVALATGAGAHDRPRSPGEIAVDFLQQLDPTGRHNLVAFRNDRPTDGRTFEPGAWREITEWVDRRDGEANIYFSPNEPASNAPHGKLQRTHIARIRALHCDVDPRDGAPFDLERKRLRDLAQALLDRPEVPPSLVNDSGGGVQLLWKLAEPLDATAYGGAAEGLNRGLIRDLGGDPGTWNLDRLLRLPGTLNLPNKKKRSRGQTERRAVMIAAAGQPVTMIALAAVHEPAATAAKADSDVDARVQSAINEIDMAEVMAASTVEDLPFGLRIKFEAAKQRSSRVERLWGGDETLLGADKSGSAWRAALAHELGRDQERFRVQELGQIFWVWDHAVQCEADRETKVTARTIARDWARCYWPNSSDRVVDRFWEPISQAAPLCAETQSHETKSKAQIEWVNPAEWANKPVAPREWLVEELIPKYETTLIYGDGGIGKTLLAHQYAICAATGVPWLGLATERARVMMFLCEDRVDEIQRRHAALCRAIGVRVEDTSGIRICSRRQEDNLLAVWDPSSGRMKCLPVWERLVADAQAFRTDVVILDTLADIYGGKEIERAQVNSFVKTCLGRLAHDIGGSVIALGHPSVSGLQSGSGTSGSSAWNNAVRSRLYLRYPRGEKNGDVRDLEQMKSNYGPKGSIFKLRWDYGAFSIIAAQTLAKSPSKAILPQIESIANAAEKALLTAIAARPTARLNPDAPNSVFFAPKVLKRLEPDALQGWTEKELADALNAALARGALKPCKVGRDGSRRQVQGLAIVADKLSNKPGLFE